MVCQKTGGKHFHVSHVYLNTEFHVSVHAKQTRTEVSIQVASQATTHCPRARATR